MQLSLLYAQLILNLTETQLNKLLNDRPNFDLRILLTGTEIQMSTLSKSFQKNPQYYLESFKSCAKMPFKTRKTIRKCLMSSNPPNELLFSLVISRSDGSVYDKISYFKSHYLHSDDYILLFNLISSTKSSFEHGETFVPLCLRRFNPTGFLYCYFCVISKDVMLILITPNRESFFSLSSYKTRFHEVRRFYYSNFIGPFIILSISRISACK